MHSISLSFDVTGMPGVRFGSAELAVTVHAPDDLQPNTSPIIVFAVPGGGYSRGYFDMHFAGHRGYSQAEHHTGEGIVLVAVDALGVGESSTDCCDEIQFEDLAATLDACVTETLVRLRAGSVSGIPAIEPTAVLGIGQSMGGCITIVTQANHHSFDGIGVLGYSAIHTRLPQRDAEQEAANAEAIKGIARGKTGRGVTDTIMQDHVFPFHFEDVPPDILQIDLAGGYPIRHTCPPFGSATIPDCAVQMMLPSVVRDEAAAVTVPVFVGNGIRDVCPDPRAEPIAYANASEIVTAVYPRMAHMHNFASTRQQLWDRLVQWYDGVAGLKAHTGNGQ